MIDLRLYKEVIKYGRSFSIYYHMYVVEMKTYFNIGIYSDKVYLSAAGTKRGGRWRRATWIGLLVCENVSREMVEEILQPKLDEFRERQARERARREAEWAFLNNCTTSGSVAGANYAITYNYSSTSEGLCYTYCAVSTNT